MRDLVSRFSLPVVGERASEAPDTSDIDSHLAVDSLYLFCACCGHGLHEDCAQNFAGSHSVSVPQTPNTVPSTPGIATPLRNWLFREGSSVVDSEEGEGFGEDAAERLAILLSRCPSACSHSC